MLPLERAPAALEHLADRLTVLLPWGSLLRALALPDPAGLARLRGLCRPGAELRVVFGLGPADAAAALPPLSDAHLGHLARAYREAGLEVTARPTSRDEVGALPTTWAKKLAFSGNERRFVELLGRAT